MRKISTTDLRQLEVINLCGGERLGYPCDFEFDMESGKILSLIVPICDGGFFGKKEEFIIPWCNIECIGEDAILIKMTREAIGNCSCLQKSSKKRGFFK